MSSFTVSPRAYRKIILHSAKYPAATVCGLLLGKAASGKVTVEDVVPLLHHWHTLSPMMEAALQMTDTYASSRELSIVGLYLANEEDDTAIPPALLKVSDLIKSISTAGAVVLSVDNPKLQSKLPALCAYMNEKGSWQRQDVPSSKVALADPLVPGAALEDVKARTFLRLGDFDEWLEDTSVDWLANSKILA